MHVHSFPPAVRYPTLHLPQTPSARAALCPCRSPPLPSACRHGQCQKVSLWLPGAACRSLRRVPAAQRLAACLPGCHNRRGVMVVVCLVPAGSLNPLPANAPFSAAVLQRKQHPRRLLLLVAFSPTHLWVVMTRTATGQEAAAGATAAARRAHMPALRRAAKSCRSLWPGLGRWLRALGGGRATNKMIEPASYAARGRLPPERVIILLWLAAPTLPQWHVFSPATGLHANSFAAGSLCSPNPLQPLCPALLPSSFLCTNPYSFDASHKLAQMPSSPLHCSCL